MTDGELADRVAALEATVAGLAAELAAGRSAPGAPVPPRPGGEGEHDGEGTFWVLEGLRQRFPAGAVVFAGDVPVPTGERYEWQWGRTVDHLLGADWSEASSTIAALAHPVRLRLLHRVLTGTDTAAALADDDGLGTTGQLYHHLRQLVSAGWLSSSGRGRYAVPGDRVVPLLVILMGAKR
jgi:hypothetical protein